MKERNAKHRKDRIPLSKLMKVHKILREHFGSKQNEDDATWGSGSLSVRMNFAGGEGGLSQSLPPLPRLPR